MGARWKLGVGRALQGHPGLPPREAAGATCAHGVRIQGPEPPGRGRGSFGATQRLQKSCWKTLLGRRAPVTPRLCPPEPRVPSGSPRTGATQLGGSWRGGFQWPARPAGDRPHVPPLPQGAPAPSPPLPPPTPGPRPAARCSPRLAPPATGGVSMGPTPEARPAAPFTHGDGGRAGDRSRRGSRAGTAGAAGAERPLPLPAPPLATGPASPPGPAVSPAHADPSAPPALLRAQGARPLWGPQGLGGKESYRKCTAPVRLTTFDSIQEVRAWRGQVGREE